MANIPLIFSILFSLICLVSLYLGIYTLYTNPRSSTNRLFFAVTVALFIWSFGFAMAISAPDIGHCLFWRRFAAIGWGVFFSILLHFMISLAGRAYLLNNGGDMCCYIFRQQSVSLCFPISPGLTSSNIT